MLVFNSPLFYFIVAPEPESRDVGSSNMPKRSCKMCIKCVEKNIVCIGFILSMVPGIHWGLGAYPPQIWGRAVFEFGMGSIHPNECPVHYSGRVDATVL